ncbi:hypothetical protein A3195_00015 [Candidatus Thiodiazotropha endoloripes]|uniref:hypothetical protein n=1 Tax=Candidatus Thiodiazotropha endoloripes TaxID=1818881 RepID=UPI00083DF19D|nr:hypothetical protein [Candidatus Thiodiazotropha endoloripes]ODB87708.1 hypothetical protein A3193_02040 [Candidatus Thiodiazotropha endoloripes]ODB89938.1 hypothetical protein A3195_00015 [Candidatus Thiodiazotropha endoloripes]
MSNTQINTVDSAYSTALLCLDYYQDLKDTADTLTQSALQSAVDRIGPDWHLDPSSWESVDTELVRGLREALQDHLRTPPESILIETLGETLAKDEYRDQWEGLTVEELEEVWQGLADHLLLGHA